MKLHKKIENIERNMRLNEKNKSRKNKEERKKMFIEKTVSLLSGSYVEEEIEKPIIKKHTKKKYYRKYHHR